MTPPRKPVAAWVKTRWGWLLHTVGNVTRSNDSYHWSVFSSADRSSKTLEAAQFAAEDELRRIRAEIDDALAHVRVVDARRGAVMDGRR